MKLKFLIISVLLSFALFSQEESKTDLKDQISKNWMYWSVSNAKTNYEPVTRIEEGRNEPSADFIISDDGTYNIRFENIGKGTWRLEGDYLILYGKDHDTGRIKLEAIFEVESVSKDKMVLTLISPTKAYDWELVLVPFN